MEIITKSRVKKKLTALCCLKNDGTFFILHQSKEEHAKNVHLWGVRLHTVTGGIICCGLSKSLHYYSKGLR